MKILYITAGAAGMYCGSCLRDNALAAELMSRGHDVALVPIYTPILTDETDVSQERVFFGGISVYLQQHMTLFRKTPWLLDRLWDSTFALKMASRRSIPVDPRLLGELTISMLEGEDGHQSKELRKLIHWLRSEPPPDIINLPNSLLIALARPIKEALGRPVCCTLQGEDLFLSGLEDSYRDRSLELIRANVEFVDGFIAVSHYYADFMSAYLGIPEEKIHVVPLGINVEGFAARPLPGSDVFKIGFFARVAPEKGLHLLCEAYRRLRSREGAPKARLEVAGYLAPEHKQYLKAIERQMNDWGYGEEFRYRGVLDRREKIEFLKNLDALSVPATYDEPKGIFLLEAMACGVPVVQPRRGAFTEVIKKTRGGLLVEPDDADALADGLLTLWKNPSLVDELGRNGFDAVREHYSAARMAGRALEAYADISGVKNQEGVKIGQAKLA
ncbi:MAG TPA: glycosyltransferase family 4 protein [Blastocatellia bacterium]|jgi:glycosyltransferase involved in cell wall biosynthesis|nr:glycosyltransferase family 4 protein [Blastocatellia bacterium]